MTTAAYTFAAGTGTARYLFTDGLTLGNWPGVYGRDGFRVVGGTTAYPAYATVTPQSAGEFIWAASTTDPRAPFNASTGTARVAGTWYNNSFNLDVNVTDGGVHQVALYMLDYDRLNRSQTLTVLDGGTNAQLDFRNLPDLAGGQYITWSVSGHGLFKITLNTPPNAVVSAIFFDPPSVNVTPRAATVAAGATQQLAALVGLTNQNVVWSVNGPGSVSVSGLYTAPATVVTQQVVTVTATSVGDVSKASNALLTLVPGTTGGAMGDVLNLIAEALCRQPHAAPVVEAGADQFVYCTGNCAASATLTGRAAEFALQPGATLAYGWSLLSGPAPVTFAAATSASSGVTFTQPGSYRLQLSINDGLVTSSGLTTVVVNPAGSGSGFFSLTPALSGPNAVRSSVNLTARLWGTQFGLPAGPLNGFPVTLTVSGANARVVNLVTDSNGDVSYVFTGINAGTDTVVATANGGTFGLFTANNATITWTAATLGLTTSAVTGTFYAGDGTGVFNTAVTATPAFAQVFPGILFNSAAVVGSPVSDLTRPFTNLMVNRAGVFLGTIPAESPTGYQAGVGALYNFNAVFTGVLSVPAAGQRVFTITRSSFC